MTKLVRTITRKYNAMKIENLCKPFGFPLQAHKTVTKDGFILTMHRLNGRKHDAKFFQGTPILLQHGLWSSSDDWLVPGPHKSLGFLLAQAGFDVWLGNTRGNNYSRSHLRLSPENNLFWDFSWHEMGAHDIPTMIDYIIKETNKTQLYYIGHSQGTTAFFVMSAIKPEYNNKVRAMFAFAPVVFLQHMGSNLLKGMAAFSDSIANVLHNAGFYKVSPEVAFLNFFNDQWTRNYANFESIANALLKEFSSFATEEVKKSMREIIVSHLSSGTSIKVLVHYAQCAQRNKPFRHFDYGPKKNSEIYNTTEAPVYNLKNLSVPVVAFYSDYDWLTNRKDIQTFVDHTRKNVIIEKVNEPNFNHLDFIWADMAKFDILPRLFRYLFVYENYFIKEF